MAVIIPFDKHLPYPSLSVSRSITETTLISDYYPSEEFHRIWKLLLLNQFHDILPGSCIKQVKYSYDGILHLRKNINLKDRLYSKPVVQF